MAKLIRQNQKAFETIVSQIKELEGKQVQAGWFASAVYYDGTPVAYVASIQEFGSPANNIPPRPFMRPAVAQNKNAWLALMQQGAKAIIRGGQTLGQVMGKLGQRASDDIAKSIEAVDSPPLKPATIRRKGFAKPLVDSGIMLQSVTYVVEDEKK